MANQNSNTPPPGADALEPEVLEREPVKRRGPRAWELYEQEMFGEREMPRMHWSVTWSDLMMTMFILFTVLFVYAGSKRDFLQAFRGHVEHENIERASKVGVTSGPVPVYSLPKPGFLPNIGPNQLYEMSKAAVAEAGLKDVRVKLEGGKIIISMHGPLLFERTKAEIKPGGERFLNLIAKVISKAWYDVQVHGHTDNFPVSSAMFPTSWELSAARAVNVARYLIEERGVNPGLVTVSGHSMYKPASPNLTAESKARNRRVEIVLTRPEELKAAEGLEQ